MFISNNYKENTIPLASSKSDDKIPYKLLTCFYLHTKERYEIYLFHNVLIWLYFTILIFKTPLIEANSSATSFVTGDSVSIIVYA